MSFCLAQFLHRTTFSDLDILFLQKSYSREIIQTSLPVNLQCGTILLQYLAGEVGFEPTYVGFKDRCVRPTFATPQYYAIDQSRSSSCSRACRWHDGQRTIDSTNHPCAIASICMSWSKSTSKNSRFPQSSHTMICSIILTLLYTSSW